MTLQQIKYFREVAKLHHFTLAAQNLYITQSSLSHAIQSLEQEIGVPLFVRKSGRKVELTSYGKTFLPYAEQILQSFDSGQEAIERMRNPNSGVVSVAYSYINGHSLVPRLFLRFYDEHSYDDISVQFEINHGRLLIEKELQMGQRDLAFSCTPAFEDLKSVPVAKQELVLLVPADHPLSGEKRVSLNDIRDEDFIGYYQNWNLSNHVNRMFESIGTRPNVVEFCDDWSSQLSYVSLGRGLAVTPRLPVDPNLVSVVELDCPDRFRDVYFHWAVNRKLSPAVNYVREYCLDVLQKQNMVI